MLANLHGSSSIHRQYSPTYFSIAGLMNAVQALWRCFVSYFRYYQRAVYEIYGGNGALFGRYF